LTLDCFARPSFSIFSLGADGGLLLDRVALFRLEEGLDGEKRRADLTRVDPSGIGSAVVDQPPPFELQEQPVHEKNEGRDASEDPENPHRSIVPLSRARGESL